ncbi:MAG: hypothetical protein ISS72_02975 [Candidatus Brocadiae bacterium]|nr:hypothetical protein [Candidatus Brocadiia bacterium]
MAGSSASSRRPATARWEQRDLPGTVLRATLSLGVAPSRPDDTARALVERAGRALYAAKRGGRDRVAVAPLWPPQSGERHPHRLDIPA